MKTRRAPLSLAVAAVALALALTLLAWPGELAWLKPNWLALALLYLALEAPGRGGVLPAFLIGLLTDLIVGTRLGEHALRLSVAVFIALRFRARLRFFPMWQQSLAVGAILVNDRFLAFLIRLAGGEGVPPLAFWLAPLSGALLWPWCFLLLDRLADRERGSP